MTVRLSIVLAIAAVLTAANSNAVAEDWLSLNQPDFITASFDAPDPKVDADVAGSNAVGACDSCNRNDCCGGCWKAGASVEATFLWPSLDATTASTSLANLGGPVVINNQAGANATDDMTVAPRIWIGAKRDCWGIGGRFWTLEQSSIASDPILDVPVGDRFTLERSLEAYTLDLEVTRDLCILGSDSMLSFGARYGWLQNNAMVESAALWSTAPIAVTSAMAMTNREFGGTGITLGLQGTRQIRCSNWHLFWNARGSILWGDGSVAAVASATSLDGAVGAAMEETWGIAGNSGDMFIGEAQLGLQYERRLSCAPCKAFVRAALEYQYWDTNVNANAAAFAVVDTIDIPGSAYGAAAVASAGNSALDLFGFSVGTGLMW